MSTTELLFMDLQLSYVRTHEAEHSAFGDGLTTAFKDCPMWACKNHREKLAEWRLTLDELHGMNEAVDNAYAAGERDTLARLAAVSR